MKETMFDILVYLFEQYGHGGTSQLEIDVVRSDMTNMGFDARAVDKAIRWLDDLEEFRLQQETTAGSADAIRVFSQRECLRIDTETRGFLLHLEQIGIVDRCTHELIIDRLMALDEEIDQELVRWVALMVLGNQPGNQEAYVWMETMLFDPPMQLVH